MSRMVYKLEVRYAVHTLLFLPCLPLCATWPWQHRTWMVGFCRVCRREQGCCWQNATLPESQQELNMLHGRWLPF